MLDLSSTPRFAVISTGTELSFTLSPFISMGLGCQQNTRKILVLSLSQSLFPSMEKGTRAGKGKYTVNKEQKASSMGKDNAHWMVWIFQQYNWHTNIELPTYSMFLFFFYFKKHQNTIVSLCALLFFPTHLKAVFC
ncbi:hypothetical protein Dimus_001670 [Dionaea muscipula]